MTAVLLLAAIELVSDGRPRLKLVTDGSEPARFAAALIQRHVVLMTGTALPATGVLQALRFQAGEQAGYLIRSAEGGVVVEGRDLVRASYDLLEGWGCRFDPQTVPKRASLSIEERRWSPGRLLWIETQEFDPSVPGQGVAVRGLKEYLPELAGQVRALGYGLRVASTSFDDFLPPSLFKQHPDWFALRQGKREARGNFALTNAAARAAYLDALAKWLAAHPEVDVVGLWPQVTTVWCEESAARGHAESYALLWREAAARFPKRRFEILATGLTLRPPPGGVPANVEVRLRPGRDASGLQGLAGQELEAVVKAWELRGARVVLEIDASPESWCGMPWPCHDALRADALRFKAAVLRNGRLLHARLWRNPERRGGPAALLERARKVSSWGHPRDAAELFFDESEGLAFKIAATERLMRLALKERDPAAANEVYMGYLSILSQLPPRAAKAYRRYRARDVRRMLEELLPRGATRRVGPARVRETFETLLVETDTLRLEIDRRTAAVTSLKRMFRSKWCAELCEGAFDVVALKVRSARSDGSVELSSPATGRLRIDLRGKLRPGGPEWRSRLDLRSGSGLIRQAAQVKAQGGIAVGCTFAAKRFDRWVCPPHAAEGRLPDRAPVLPLPAGTLLYCRDGESGIGLAARLTHGGMVTVGEGLVATRRSATITVDWIVFAGTGELGR